MKAALGNDIVSLIFISNTKHDNIRYVNKILTHEEKQIVAGSDLKENMLWLLWSVKESTYKTYSRFCPDYPFSAMAISAVPSCLTLAEYITDGEIIESSGFNNIRTIESVSLVCGMEFFCKSVLTKNYIHTFSCDSNENLNRVHWGFAEIPEVNSNLQSVTARLLARRHIAEIYSLREMDIHIPLSHEIAAGPPVIFVDKKLSTVPVSISHHNKHVGYCFL